MASVELIDSLPPGDAGTFTTLRMMAQMIRRRRPVVEQRARQIAAGAPLNQAAARLFYFVRDHVRNSPDPPGIEYLQAPHVTLGNPVGDCDDKATLLAALLASIGVPVRLVAIGIRSRALVHVYLEAQLYQGELGPQWLPMDPKNPHAFPGWAFPRPVRVERMEVD